MTRRGRAVRAWAIASILAVLGVVVLIVGLLTPVSFGWFAYQPLAGATFMPAGDGVFVSHITLIGFLVLTIGLLALAFLAGWRLARTRPAPGNSDPMS